MNLDIKVLHYADETSDKIWAVDPKPNANGGHDVWYGRRDKVMTFRPTEKSDWISLHDAKIRKGYECCSGLTIDRNTNMVVARGDPENIIPNQFWFRISTQVPETQIAGFLASVLNTFTEQFRDEATTLASLPVFKSLLGGSHSGGAELSEGPLAILLLFALRRHLTEQGPSASLSFAPIEIVDDDNTLLTDSFDELAELYGTSKEFSDMRQSCPTADFRKYAIALGAIEAPIDLTVIESNTKAAFF